MIRHAILGLIQGLTEFLPVSSSGHLVLAQRLLGIDPPGVLLETVLHLGTLAAVILAFRKDLIHLAKSLTPRGSLEGRKEIGLLIAGTVPIVVAGLLLRGTIGQLFDSLWVVGGALLATGGALLAADRLSRRSTVRTKATTFVDAVKIGLAQTLSLLPGLSRNGITVAAGVSTGLSPRRAARFSFLLSIPALAGAGLLHLVEVLRDGLPPGVNAGGLALACAVSFVVGWTAIRGFLALVSRGRLWIFSAYCLGLGGLVLLWNAGVFG